MIMQSSAKGVVRSCLLPYLRRMEKIQQIVKKHFKSTDADAVFIKHMCLKVNKGVGYKFVGDSTGKTVLIRFSCQELESKRSNSKMKRGL